MKEGKLPEGWEWKNLKDIAEINPGIERNNLTPDSEVTFLPMRCVEAISGKMDTSNIRRYEAVKTGYTPIKEGDLLFAKITPCIENGKIAVASNLKNGVGFASTEFHTLRFNSDNAAKYYFFYLLQEKIRQEAARNMTGTAGQQRVPTNFLQRLKTPVPPLPIQRQIVAILEQAEATKRLRAESDELTQRFLQSVFMEMFGDPVKNEEGWDVVKFGEICGITSGHGFKFSEYSDEGVKLLRINNVTFGQIIWDQIAFLPENYIQDYAKLVLNEGDILIALNRPILGNQLKIGLMKKVDSPAILYQRVGRVDHHNDKVNQIFLYQFMRTTYFLNELSARLSGSDQPYINPTEMVKITLPLPPLALQQEFARIVEQVEALRERQRQSAGEIDLLFEGMMQKAFTGELVA